MAGASNGRSPFTIEQLVSKGSVEFSGDMESGFLDAPEAWPVDCKDLFKTFPEEVQQFMLDLYDATGALPRISELLQ